MARRIPLDEAAWAEVRRRYVETPASIRKIATDFGISPGSLTLRAATEGWPLRPPDAPPTKGKPGDRAGGARGHVNLLPDRREQRAAVSRLFRAISKKLEQMEERMSNGEQRSAQDEERETRALATMIRNFEKVTEAVTDFDRAKKPAAGEPATTRADAERMRREIAERLERLHGGRDTKREPGDAG